MEPSTVRPCERIKEVSIFEDTLSVDLVDGRIIAVPLEWYPCLLQATAEQRANWNLYDEGGGIVWPDIGEKIPIAWLLDSNTTACSSCPRRKG